MSWDADLLRRVPGKVTSLDFVGQPRVAVVHDVAVYRQDRSWNFTHNTSPMIYATLLDADALPPSPDGRGCVVWWRHLDGMTGAEGWALLRIIVAGLEADPERFRAMNPPNGWGDYDGMIEALDGFLVGLRKWPDLTVGGWR